MRNRGSSQIVETPYGALRGIQTRSMIAFLGVPYAEPPVDQLRWRPPKRVSPWVGERSATEFGPWCAQNVLLHGLGAPSNSEDCLYLNVFAPREPPDAPRPVMVWFHGGGLWCGRPNDYNPRQLVEDGDVIFVSVGYRLNVFGFFAHPALADESGPRGNYGLQDQQAALQWVQECIEDFGGDPKNVTICGQSAGARSVEAHLCSPTSAGFFHRAIIQSGRTGGLASLTQAEEIGMEFAKALGESNPTSTDLRKLPADVILSANTPAAMRQRGSLAILGMGGPYTTGLIQDGLTVPAALTDSFASGSFHRVPVILGVARDEGTWFVGLDEVDCGTPLTAEDYQGLIASSFPSSVANQVAQLYPISKDPAAAAATMLGDYVFIAPERRTVKAIASHNPRTYAYVFDVPDTPNTFLAMRPQFGMGSTHMAELPYLFETFRGASGPGGHLTSDQSILAAEIRRYWTSFARDGEPGDRGTGQSSWRRYEPAGDNFMRLSTPRAVEWSDLARMHNCEFWDEVA